MNNKAGKALGSRCPKCNAFVFVTYALSENQLNDVADQIISLLADGYLFEHLSVQIDPPYCNCGYKGDAWPFVEVSHDKQANC